MVEMAVASSGFTKADDTSGYRVFTEQDQGFFALLGSQNGGMVMHMLIDHKHHIGLRYVEKVVVLGQSSQQSSPDFYFVLSERRNIASPSNQPLPDSTENSPVD